jgi:Tol biopolymer transport system component/DNA-binding winged helix-turn-helix (wHTH) protein
MIQPAKRPDLKAARARRATTKIGDWVLHPDLGLLRNESGEVRLNAKSLHVLLVLLDAGDKGVSRESLLDQVWGESYPTDSVISRAMADLRAAFGEKAGEQKYIRTLPKYGYQFVAEHCDFKAGESQAAATTPSHARRYRHHYLLGAVVLAAIIFLPQVVKNPPPTETPLIVLAGQRPLTSAPGLEHQPRIIPGSEWVVYAVMRRDRSDWDLFRVSLADGLSQPVAVTPGVHEHGPAISPYGDELAYVRLSDSGCEVVTQSIALGVPEPLARCTQKFATLVDWSPTENWLAYTIAQRIEVDRLRRLYLVDRFSGQMQRLTNNVSPTGTDFYPRFSPAGRQVAFLRGEPQPDHRTTLWIVNVDTGEEKQLTDFPAQLGGMAWIDESRLLYSFSDAGRMRTRWLDVISGESRPIESVELVHPEYSRDEKLLVATALRSDRDLVLLSADGELRTVAQSTSDDHHGTLSPDEAWLAFISQRSGSDELWIAATGDDAARRLTRFDGATVRYPDWHPDGQRILVTVQTGAGEKLYTVDIVSGTATLVPTSFADLTTPRWLADGEHWVAGCRNADGWGICLGNAGNVTRIADGYYRPRPYIDGGVTVVDSDGTLFSLSLSDGSVDELWDGLPGNGRYGWVVDRNHKQLFFLAGGETGNTGRLYRRDLTSGEIEVLYSGPMPLADSNISIGMQTGTILFTRFEDSSDDLVVFEGVDLY